MKDKSFKSTHRHGKYLFTTLSDGKYLLMHFGMTGGLKYFKKPEQEPEYTRLLIGFNNGYKLAYDNQRKLGKLNLLDNIDKYLQKVELGPDVLDSDFDFSRFRESVKGRTAMIKSFLMNQKIMSGIGNIYSDEILFKAGIHPRTKVNELNEKQLRRLFKTIKYVMKKSIDKGPEPQKLPDSFIIPHRNEGDKCPVCGGEVKRVKVSGRSAYYCPNCQKKM